MSTPCTGHAAESERDEWESEVERLANAYGEACVDFVLYGDCNGMDASRAALLDHIRSGVPDQLDGTDVADMVQATDATQETAPAPAEVPMPEPDCRYLLADGSPLYSYMPHTMRTYGDSREAAGYARAMAQKGGV